MLVLKSSSAARDGDSLALSISPRNRVRSELRSASSNRGSCSCSANRATTRLRSCFRQRRLKRRRLVPALRAIRAPMDSSVSAISNLFLFLVPSDIRSVAKSATTLLFQGFSEECSSPPVMQPMIVTTSLAVVLYVVRVMLSSPSGRCCSSLCESQADGFAWECPKFGGGVPRGATHRSVTCLSPSSTVALPSGPGCFGEAGSRLEAQVRTNEGVAVLSGIKTPTVRPALRRYASATLLRSSERTC
mmetsp:Transcript_2645/g.7954  ORF Transcript_2645/g.7954 Transcript_2645/m.7954 type:complete len:246 (-) Transcript_2645:1572-2309(-)